MGNFQRLPVFIWNEACFDQTAVNKTKRDSEQDKTEIYSQKT